MRLKCTIKRQPLPKVGFLMIDLPDDMRSIPRKAEKVIKSVCKKEGFKIITSDDLKKGGDFLCKICDALQSAAFGIAFYHDNIDKWTLANILYEVGRIEGFHKPIILIKCGNKDIPSNLGRTEHIISDKPSHMGAELKTRLKNIKKLSKTYEALGDTSIKNEIERGVYYYINAYLISKDKAILKKVKDVYDLLKSRLDLDKETRALKTRLVEDLGNFLEQLPELKVAKPAKTKPTQKSRLADAKAKAIANSIPKSIVKQFISIYEWLLQERTVKFSPKDKCVIRTPKGYLFRNFHHMYGYMVSFEQAKQTMVIKGKKIKLSAFGKKVLDNFKKRKA